MTRAPGVEELGLLGGKAHNALVSGAHGEPAGHVRAAGRLYLLVDLIQAALQRPLPVLLHASMSAQSAHAPGFPLDCVPSALHSGALLALPVAPYSGLSWRFQEARSQLSAVALCEWGCEWGESGHIWLPGSHPRHS